MVKLQQLLRHRLCPPRSPNRRVAQIALPSVTQLVARQSREGQLTALDSLVRQQPISPELSPKRVLDAIIAWHSGAILERMLRFKQVIFDCDGVLVDSEPIDDEVVSVVLKEQGLYVEPDGVARRSKGLSDADMWTLFESEFGLPFPKDMMDRLEVLRKEIFKQRLQAMPGVISVVRKLVDMGVPICVASSGTLEKMEVTLGVTGLARYFGDRVFSATMVANGKPAPDLFLLAAQRMGVSPKECVVIEDSHSGVRAGLAAGMTVFGYCPSGDMWNLKELGIKTFADMDDLIGLLGLDDS